MVDRPRLTARLDGVLRMSEIEIRLNVGSFTVRAPRPLGVNEVQVAIRDGEAIVSYIGVEEHVANSNAVVAKLVNEQLPRTLKDRFIIRISGDPHWLRTRCTLIEGNKAVASFELEECTFMGGRMRAKIPDATLAHLCVSVGLGNNT